jgi:hypothetical protein
MVTKTSQIDAVFTQSAKLRSFAPDRLKEHLYIVEVSELK